MSSCSHARTYTAPIRYLAIEAVQKPTDDPGSLALYMGGRARVWTSCNRDEIYGVMVAQAANIGITLKEAPGVTINAAQQQRTQ